MATLVLTVVGTVLGGPVGAAIGAAVGQVVDSTILFAPKGRRGPRINDLRLQTSRYGDQIPKLFGTMRVAGSVIWATDLKERRNKQGGGKGQPSVTTYSYSASFAVALSARRILEVRRIWADGNLLRGGAGDFKTAIGAFRLHDGGEDQTLDPLIAAQVGSGMAPAHRGVACAVFEDLQLADFGNRIPSLTFEVVSDLAPVEASVIAAQISGYAIESGTPGETPALAGYAAGGGSISDALLPLSQGFDLALRAGGGGIRLSAVGASEGAIAADLVATRFNGKPERGWRLTRGRSEDVPVRLAVRYYDPARDYQAGVQIATRAGPGRKHADIDLPAVSDAIGARALAEARLQRMWVDRGGLELRCDWRALTLEPGATVTVETQPGLWRVEQREWQSMGVRLTLKRCDSGVFAPPSAHPGVIVAQPDVAHGSTTLIVADLPVIGDTLPAGPVVVAAAAGAQTGWRSAELFVKDQATAALTSIGGTAAPAIIGTVLGLPNAGVQPHLFDTVSAVDVQLLNGEMMLTGADQASLVRGANSALLGREVIQFGEAVPLGSAIWRLRRLLRGRRGTEWAMAAHEAGERFLLLEPECVVSTPPQFLAIGATLQINAIGIGDSVPAEASENVQGQAVVPPSPVHVRGQWTGGDWRMDWTRRSRIGWRWNDGIDAPLGEEQELYRVNLVQSGAVFRSVTLSSPSWIYDAASIAADRGAGISGAVIAQVCQIGTHGTGRAASIGFVI